VSDTALATAVDDIAAALVGAGAVDVVAARPLPSREALQRVVDALRVALFAAELGPRGLTATERERFVAHTLSAALATLEDELTHEPSCQGDARPYVAAFARELPALRAALVLDLEAAVAGDPAASGPTEVLLCYPGFTAVLHHRVAHVLSTLGVALVARTIADLAHTSTGIDIHPGAQIGPRFFIDHGTGVVIGQTAVVGAGVRLYQGVTLGARNFPTDAAGKLIRGAPRHPILEDDVTVFAGASILGRVTIGRGSVIGGGVWLTRSVPPNSRVLQAPVREECFADGGGI
jgi:serine O-acetyltransferase